MTTRRGRRRGFSVAAPDMGLYLDRPPLLIPERALRDCLNVRIKNKMIERRNIGYGPFPDGTETPINLDGKPVIMIDNFFPRAGGQFLLFANTTDIFEYLEGPEEVRYLTPRYEVGTVSVTNGSSTVTGSGTSWTGNLKAGDFIHVGATGERTQTAVWYEIAEVVSDTELTLTENYNETTESGEDYTARMAFTATMEDYWEKEVFFDGTELTVGTDGDRWYGTNGVDHPVAWEDGMDQVYFPDFGNISTCRAFAKTKNILMLLSLTLDTGERRPFSIRTSAIGEPENMVTLEASEFVIHDGADEITTAFALGENIAIYGERSITLAQFVGPPTVFVFRNVMNGFGPRAGRAIADFGDFHKFIGPDSMYTFDGIGIEEVDTHVWQDAIRQTSPQRMKLINSHFDEEQGELIWVLPLNTDADAEAGPPEKAFVEHYLEEPGDNVFGAVHTKREIPAISWGFFERLTTLTFDQIEEAWADQNYRWNDQFFQGSFPFNIFGTATGDVFVVGTRDSANGEPMTSFARFGRVAIGDIRRKGLLRRVYPMVETLPSAEHDLNVRVHMADEPGGRTTLQVSQDYPMTQEGNHFISTRRMARFVELEFRTTGTGHIWSLMGYDLDVVPGGER
jgi:hypothetical protein